MPDQLGNPFHTLTLTIHGLSGYNVGAALSYVGELLGKDRLQGFPIELELDWEPEDKAAAGA